MTTRTPYRHDLIVRFHLLLIPLHVKYYWHGFVGRRLIRIQVGLRAIRAMKMTILILSQHLLTFVSSPPPYIHYMILFLGSSGEAPSQCMNVNEKHWRCGPHVCAGERNVAARSEDSYT